MNRKGSWFGPHEMPSASNYSGRREIHHLPQPIYLANSASTTAARLTGSYSRAM